jgi:hypothetical protein
MAAHVSWTHVAKRIPGTSSDPSRRESYSRGRDGVSPRSGDLGPYCYYYLPGRREGGQGFIRRLPLVLRSSSSRTTDPLTDGGGCTRGVGGRWGAADAS